MKNLISTAKQDPFEIKIGCKWFDEAPLDGYVYPVELAVMMGDSIQDADPENAKILHEYKKHLKPRFNEMPKYFAITDGKVEFFTNSYLKSAEGKEKHLKNKPIPANLMAWAKIVGSVWEQGEKAMNVQKDNTSEELEVLAEMIQAKISAPVDYSHEIIDEI